MMKKLIIPMIITLLLIIVANVNTFKMEKSVQITERISKDEVKAIWVDPIAIEKPVWYQIYSNKNIGEWETVKEMNQGGKIISFLLITILLISSIEILFMKPEPFDPYKSPKYEKHT